MPIHVHVRVLPLHLHHLHLLVLLELCQMLLRTEKAVSIKSSVLIVQTYKPGVLFCNAVFCRFAGIMPFRRILSGAIWPGIMGCCRIRWLFCCSRRRIIFCAGS